MGNEIAIAAVAARQFKHSALNKTHQRPCAGQRQQGTLFLLWALFKVKFVGFDHGVNAASQTGFEKILPGITEHGSVNILLPRHKPVGRKRQHAFRRGTTT